MKRLICFDVEALGHVAGVGFMERKIRVLVAKPGLDGHDRGAKYVARVLRDEGFEVIYTGLHQTSEQVVAAALQENVDLIGLSILSGGQIPLLTRITQLLKEKSMEDVPVIVGGIIPRKDREALKELGVAKVFGPGTHSSEIVQSIKALVEREGDGLGGGD
jgi:methylmalonyl-CoA mutase C-terminal domain/subunit